MSIELALLRAERLATYRALVRIRALSLARLGRGADRIVAAIGHNLPPTVQL